MPRRYRVEYSEVVYYTPVEVEAESEDEAQEIVQGMIENNDMEITDRDFNDLEVEDITEE